MTSILGTQSIQHPNGTSAATIDSTGKINAPVLGSLTRNVVSFVPLDQILIQIMAQAELLILVISEVLAFLTTLEVTIVQQIKNLHALLPDYIKCTHKL